jgi:hypothetical protein
VFLSNFFKHIILVGCVLTKLVREHSQNGLIFAEDVLNFELGKVNDVRSCVSFKKFREGISIGLTLEKGSIRIFSVDSNLIVSRATKWLATSSISGKEQVARLLLRSIFEFLEKGSTRLAKVDCVDFVKLYLLFEVIAGGHVFDSALNALHDPIVHSDVVSPGVISNLSIPKQISRTSTYWNHLRVGNLVTL